MTLILALAMQLALLTGQSNACILNSYIPPGNTVLVCQSGASIRAWDARDQGTSGVTGQNLDLSVRTFDPSYVVFWQGESDGLMDYHEYYARTYDVLHRTAVRPDGTIRSIMIIKVANDAALQTVRAVHFNMSFHPSVALIETDDLPRPGPGDVHLTPSGYEEVVRRLISCITTSCWRTQ